MAKIRPEKLRMTEEKNAVTLGELATRYLNSLPGPEREANQQEVNRFVRWYGWDKLVGQLTPGEVANYVERVASAASDPARVVEPVRGLLSYAKSQGLMEAPLSSQLRVRRGGGRAAAPRGAAALPPPRLTPQGFHQLHSELESLQKERGQVLAEVKRAREDKDFRENAPLHAARERLAHIDSRIQYLDALLAPPVAEEKKEASRATLGSAVSLLDPASGQNLHYTLVDPSEANPSQGKVSIASPLGKALSGKGPGDEVEVLTPRGGRRYRIQAIAP